MLLPCVGGLGWTSMNQTTHSYTQAGTDRGVKKKWGFFGGVWVFGFLDFFRGEKEMQPFMVKWLHFFSRSWTFGVKKQSGRWDLLIHPFGPGSRSHLQVKSMTLRRAGLWTPYSHKQTITHTNSSTAVNRTIHVRPVWLKGYVFTIYQGLLCGHPQDQTHLPLTLMDCNRWPWCSPSVASEHPWPLNMGWCYPPARHALVALSWGSHMGKS